ncbi:MAG: tetratricopeptide repeat protein [Deltaproteobacteria bacterium]|nr:tetratricopeptide repeat protein [Deltaproteobacteria bacterium]MBW2305975.1 tetratricopeptide repeat protein [Deltaproteobacteria bacterium]
MSTILDALAKAKQEKGRRGNARPSVTIPPSRPRGKGRGLWILLPAAAVALAVTLLVTSLRPHWAEPVLVAMGFGKKQEASTIEASKPSVPSAAEKTSQQKPGDVRRQGFLEILMKSKEGGTGGKAKPVFPSGTKQDRAAKDNISGKTIPPFLQKIKKSDSTARASVKKSSPTQQAENPFARLLAAKKETSSQKSRSTTPAHALGLDIQASGKSALASRELFNQGVDLEKAGKPQEAIAAYRKAIAADKNFSRAYINLGNLYLNRRKNPRQAIFMYRRALENSPGNPKAHNNMGVAFMALEQFDKAEAELLKAVKLDTKFVDPLYNLSCLFARKRDAATALSWLKKAHTLGGDEIIRWAMKDQDLENLRKFPAYRNFLKTTQSTRENLGK